MAGVRVSEMRARLVGVAYGAAWAGVRRIPEPVGRWVFARVADALWRRRGKGVTRLEANLRRVLGPDASPARIRAVSRAGMRSYMRYFYDFFRLPEMSEQRILANTRDLGTWRILDHLKEGRGVVAALPHMGNYDHAGAYIALSGAPFTTVAERLEPASLFDRFVATREAVGMEVLPLDKGANTVGTLARRLREPRLVCLLADRDLGSTGVEVEFFGEPARVPAGPAALALQTGAALLPASMWYEGRNWVIRVQEEIPVPDSGTRTEKVQAMMQALIKVLETEIAAHPQDWHMLQRVFTADLDPSRAPRREADGQDPDSGTGLPAPDPGPVP